MKTTHALLTAALFLSVSSCGKFSADITSTDRKTDSQMQTGQKVGKTLYNGWTVFDAWNDAVEKIGPHDELAIGQYASLAIVSQVGDLVLDDEELIRYVNSVANHVALQGARQVKEPRTKGRRFFVGILRSNDVNAFSTPGGNLFVTTGLLAKLNSESELAFVLGHEIAHVDYEHGLIALKRAVKGDEALKSSIQVLLKKDKDSDPVLNLFEDLGVYEKASFAFADLVASKATVFSPAQEAAADATGLEYVVKAGYDPACGERVLDLLKETTGDQKTMSHGLPSDRLATLAKAAKKHEAKGKTGFTRWQEKGLARLDAAEAARASRSEPPAP